MPISLPAGPGCCLMDRESGEADTIAIFCLLSQLFIAQILLIRIRIDWDKGAIVGAVGIKSS